MTRQEANDKSGIMLAYADGKEIQFFKKDRPDLGWTTIDNPAFDFERNNYRIKPEPTYRPFANAEECWQEMQKHQPFGWVRCKEVGSLLCINYLCNKTVSAEFGCLMSLEILFDKGYTFADGEPFGVKEDAQ